MSNIDYLIARGKTLTGRKLRDALHAATGKVVGGRGIIVRTINGHSVVSITGHTPRAAKSKKFFPARIILPSLFAPNRWLYEWQEVVLQNNNVWVTLQGGRTSAGDPFARAFNLSELLNTEFVVLGGVIIDTLPGDFLLLSVQVQQIVPMEETKKPDGTNGYWFDFTNSPQIGCPVGAGGAEPPPPTLLRQDLLA